MHRTRVESSNIRSIGYDVTTGELEVEFLNKTIYVYLSVELRDYLELMSAESKGSHLNKHVKPKYKVKPVDRNKGDHYN